MKMPIFNIHDLILVLTLTQCVLLAILQWLLSKQKALASTLLALFFVCVGSSSLANLLLWNDYIHPSSSVAKLGLIAFAVFAVAGKSLSLYFYVLASTRAALPWRACYGWHLALLVMPVLLVLVLDLHSDRWRYLPDTHTSVSLFATKWLMHYIKLVPLVYALAAIVEIHRYKRQLKAFYSSVSLQGPVWLLMLVCGFALNWLWTLLVHLLGQYLGESADGLGIIDNYATFFLVNALFVYSLVHAHQLLLTNESPAPKDNSAPSPPAPEVIARIRSTMEQQQLYLTPNLTLEDFARQVGMHYREVSSIINTSFNTNFFEFVNEYRVERAKQLLHDPAFAHLTILDILLESGFNSKSSFNRFFKRYTGISAAEFRKQRASEGESAS